MSWLVTLPGRIIGALDIIAIAIGVTVLAFAVYPDWMRQAREDGAATERLKWVAEMEDLRARRDAAIAAAQRKIDDAESGMLTARISTNLKVNELEAALAAERAAHANDTPEAAGKPGAVCRPRRMPDRVRNALNAFRDQ